MRRKRGAMGMLGLIVLGVIFVMALLYVPEIFGHIHEASNVTGTIYEAPYSAVENVTYTVGVFGLPSAGFFIFLIAFIVALGWLYWTFGR